MSLVDFIQEVCEEYGVSKEDLFGRCRQADAVDARRAIASDLYWGKGWSVGKIACLFGRSRGSTRLGKGFMKFDLEGGK